MIINDMCFTVKNYLPVGCPRPGSILEKVTSLITGLWQPSVHSDVAF